MDFEKKINTIILGMVVYYQVVLNSAWQYLETGPLWKIIGYALYAAVLYQIIFRIFHRKFSVGGWLTLGVFGSLMMLFLVMGNLAVASVFLLGLFAVMLDSEHIVDAFLYGIIAAMVTVFGMALLRILPLYNTDIQYWVFGFKNPNNVGYYLLLTFALLLVKQWKRPSWSLLIFWLVSSYLDVVWLVDDTALLVSLVLLGLWGISVAWPHFFTYHWVQFLIVCIPVGFTLLSVAIGKLFGRLDILYKLNRVFTLRPAIWHYYLSSYHIKLFGSNVPQNVSAFDGALDGMYIYFPFINGLVVSIVVLAIVTFSLKRLTSVRNVPILCLMITLLVFGLSENAPAIVYTSPLLLLAMHYGTPILGALSASSSVPETYLNATESHNKEIL